MALSAQLVLMCATAAEAQRSQPQRPYRGLFGQRERTKPPPQWTDFTMSLSSGYDENALEETGADAGTLPSDRVGLYSNVQSALRYTRERRGRRLTISGADTVRYYATSRLLTANVDGGVSFSSPLWRGSRLDLSQNVAYTPYYQFEIFPALPVDANQVPTAPSSDYAIGKQSANTYNSAIGFAHSFRGGSVLSLGFDRRSVMFPDAGNRNLLTQGGGVRFAHRVTRYAGFHVGIGTRVAQYGRSDDAIRMQTRDLDIGLDYDRPLSFSRRTTFSFSTGSSLTPQLGKMQYHITGNATLTHEMARTWTANLQYSRAVQFVEAFPEPYFSDSISARIRGNPSRRTSVAFTARYATGVIGNLGAVAGSDLGTYTANSELGIAVNRHVALYSDYLYYHYRLDQQTLATFLPGRLDRQTVRVGLKLWVPVFD